MNKSLEEFVNRHWVKKLPQVNTETKDTSDLGQQASLYRRAGFTQLAKTVEDQKHDLDHENTRQQVIRRFLRDAEGKILLKVPPFQQIKIEKPSRDRRIAESAAVMAVWASALVLPTLLFVGPLELGIVAISAVFPLMIVFTLVWANRDIERWNFQGTSIGNGKVVAEVAPEKYMGHVPEKIAQKAIQISEQGLSPKVWFVGNKAEVESLVKSEKIVRVDPLLVATPRGYKYDYAILEGVWGEDLEDLDKYFSTQ